MQRYGSIYKITCLVTGKVYVGQTTNSVSRRFSSHISKAKAQTHYQALHAAIRLYGIEQFKCEEIAIAFDKQGLDKLEEDLIQSEQSMSPAGYNMLSKAGHGAVFSAEARAKISASLSGRSVSLAQRELMSERTKERLKHTVHPRLGIKLSNETKQKIGSKNRQRKRSDELKARYSIRFAGVGNPMFGKHHSDVTKQKISMAKKAKSLGVACKST